jgi:hypothetical protein
VPAGGVRWEGTRFRVVERVTKGSSSRGSGMSKAGMWGMGLRRDAKEVGSVGGREVCMVVDGEGWEEWKEGEEGEEGRELSYTRASWIGVSLRLLLVRFRARVGTRVGV